MLYLWRYGGDLQLNTKWHGKDYLKHSFSSSLQCALFALGLRFPEKVRKTTTFVVLECSQWLHGFQNATGIIVGFKTLIRSFIIRQTANYQKTKHTYTQTSGNVFGLTVGFATRIIA